MYMVTFFFMLEFNNFFSPLINHQGLKIKDNEVYKYLKTKSTN